MFVSGSKGRTYVVEVFTDGAWRRVVTGWFYTKQRAARCFQQELLDLALQGKEVRLRSLRGR